MELAEFPVTGTAVWFVFVFTPQNNQAQQKKEYECRHEVFLPEHAYTTTRRWLDLKFRGERQRGVNLFSLTIGILQDKHLYFSC